jgi:hypothetical protein
MNVLLFVIGIALVLIAFLDALWTTLWVDGNAGPVSSRLTTWCWRALLAAIGRRRHAALSLFGPFILMLVVVMWMVLLWAGWTLIYGAGEHSLLRASTQEPADWSARFYFVGYMMFTAGNGDFSPNGDGWQIAGAITNATGMLLATLAITYLLSVVSAVVQKRAFASQVTGLGNTAAEIVEGGWDGRNLRSLDLPISGLSSELAQLTERYLAYPVLQYYHAAKPQKSPVVAAALLDDALSLICFGVSAENRPSPAVIQAARASVRSFLDTLPSAFIDPAPNTPKAPDLSALRKAGIPTVSDEEFSRALEGISHRRRMLLGLVRNDGWDWDAAKP